MLRILFFLLLIPNLQSQAQGAIEIYANGHKYDSIQAYQLSEKPTIKSSHSKYKGLSDSTLQQLYALSVENGVTGVLQDFYQGWERIETPVVRILSSQQLQKAIQLAVTSSQDPKLLITGRGKMRIMGLTNP